MFGVEDQKIERVRIRELKFLILVYSRFFEFE